MIRTLVAWGPLEDSPSSYSTFAPSARVRKPSPEIPEKWTNASLPPSSGVMNPKPFSSLNHFTTPVANPNTSSQESIRCARWCCRALPSRMLLHRAGAAADGADLYHPGRPSVHGSTWGLRAAPVVVAVPVARRLLRGRLVRVGIEAR